MTSVCLRFRILGCNEGDHRARAICCPESNCANLLHCRKPMASVTCTYNVYYGISKLTQLTNKCLNIGKIKRLSAASAAPANGWTSSDLAGCCPEDKSLSEKKPNPTPTEEASFHPRHLCKCQQQPSTTHLTTGSLLDVAGHC